MQKVSMLQIENFISHFCFVIERRRRRKRKRKRETDICQLGQSKRRSDMNRCECNRHHFTLSSTNLLLQNTIRLRIFLYFLRCDCFIHFFFLSLFLLLRHSHSNVHFSIMENIMRILNGF